MSASGVGSMPGGAYGAERDSARSYEEATRIVVGEVDLPHVPELPGRGAVATMTGRGAGLVSELGMDLQPAGWRLTDGPGVDQRRARSLLAQDLDTVEALAQGSTGWFKAQVIGPWTLAATVEKPRGDLVLADHGARRELGQALAAAVADHVADLRRRMPGVSLLIQLDEPALPAVLGGEVPTASGFGRHRVVHPPEASELLQTVLDAAKAALGADGDTVVHCCAPSCADRPGPRRGSRRCLGGRHRPRALLVRRTGRGDGARAVGPAGSDSRKRPVHAAGRRHLHRQGASSPGHAGCGALRAARRHPDLRAGGGLTGVGPPSPRSGRPQRPGVSPATARLRERATDRLRPRARPRRGCRRWPGARA